MAFVALYQRALAGRASPCRFWPTCSAYAMEALEVHGLWRGGWLAARRLGRCHPWGSWGPDPVPERGVSRSAQRSDTMSEPRREAEESR